MQIKSDDDLTYSATGRSRKVLPQRYGLFRGIESAVNLQWITTIVLIFAGYDLDDAIWRR